MSTRATYLFKANDFSPETCLYIHHDGYEAGAAQYFNSALYYHGKRRNITAETMIRANDRAELTHSHESHGDTEYRYTIAGDMLTAAKGYGENWVNIYYGTVLDFVKKHHPIISLENTAA